MLDELKRVMTFVKGEENASYAYIRYDLLPWCVCV